MGFDRPVAGPFNMGAAFWCGIEVRRIMRYIPTPPPVPGCHDDAVDLRRVSASAFPQEAQ